MLSEEVNVTKEGLLPPARWAPLTEEDLQNVFSESSQKFHAPTDFWIECCSELMTASVPAAEYVSHFWRG